MGYNTHKISFVHHTACKQHFSEEVIVGFVDFSDTIFCHLTQFKDTYVSKLFSLNNYITV